MKIVTGKLRINKNRYHLFDIVRSTAERGQETLSTEVLVPISKSSNLFYDEGNERKSDTLRALHVSVEITISRVVNEKEEAGVFQ